METLYTDTEDTEKPKVTYTGRVKWFNNRSGYGFIKVISDEKKDEDIFVHHSAITVKGDQYRYLVQGEYIEFELQKSNDNVHPYQACNVSGLKDGPLMCETHFFLKKNRFKNKDQKMNNVLEHDNVLEHT